MARRVVITGMGAVTPLGLNVATTWEGLINGRSGAGPITRFDPTGFETQIACEVKNFDPSNYLDRKEARRMDRFTHLAVAATREALDDANLAITPSNADDVGIIIGSCIGGIETLSQQFKVLFDKGPERLSPFLCTMMIANMAAGHVSIVFGVRGPNHCTVSACASGAHAIGEAFETIRRGAAPVMLAGGAEAPVVPIGIGTFNSMRALSTRNDAPEKASRPFDLDRDGFVIGEGAGIVVLEDLDHARGRDARIYGEVIGYGATADAVHVTAPSEGGSGAANAIARACAEADLLPSAIDYINAHGTSTPLNDRAETAAIRSLFGEHAYRIPISSTKSMTGHLLGAAGAVETIICVLTIQHGVIPPTINQEHPDPECDLDYVPNVARRAPVRVALSNSLGFGGHNVSLIVRAWEP
ncbi:MAG TPA: beta-ketoacyl-ACP synthase II [Chloroflexota bacterium]|nr:beta-ketoacyl-ACP synthase II [Chloroflexota bacterium]